MSNDLTKDEIVKMAREAGLWVTGFPTEHIEHFAALCRAPLVAENAVLKQAHEINADTLNAMQVELPRREYDGTPVVVFDSDTYFFDDDSIADWLAYNDIKPEDAQLVFCKPNYLRQLAGEEWADYLPEDGELSDAVSAALDALNAVIAAEPPASWSEGNEAVVLPANAEITGLSG